MSPYRPQLTAGMSVVVVDVEVDTGGSLFEVDAGLKCFGTRFEMEVDGAGGDELIGGSFTFKVPTSTAIVCRIIGGEVV